MKRNVKLLGLAGCLLLAAVWAGLQYFDPEDYAEEMGEINVGPKPVFLQDVLNDFGDAPELLPADQRPVRESREAANPAEWRYQVFQDGYQDSGHANARWDTNAVIAFTELANHADPDEPLDLGSLREPVTALVAAGCADPLVLYLDTLVGDPSRANRRFMLDLLDVHNHVLKSNHRPLVRFLVGLDTIKNVREAGDTLDPSPRVDRVTADLIDLIRDPNAPIGEVFAAARLWFKHEAARAWRAQFIEEVFPELQERHGESADWFRFLGEVELTLAWQARGTGTSNRVSSRGWQGFKTHGDRAEASLEYSWRLDPLSASTAYLMMRVELAQGRGRERMETWFNRAMALYPDFFDAASLMSFYLEERWYGSDAEALEFARTCVESDTWGGRVPLVLAKTHESIATYYGRGVVDRSDYWLQPGVWDDVEASYAKFVSLDPPETKWRQDYARHAYFCGQYEVFLEQGSFFSEAENHEYFGGKHEFETMVDMAKRPRTASEAPRSLILAVNSFRAIPFEPETGERAAGTSRPATNKTAWIQQTLHDDYRASGHTNATWDSLVETAHSAYARDIVELSEESAEALREAAHALEGVECDDSVIRFLVARANREETDRSEFAFALLDLHDTMLRGDHPPFLRHEVGVETIIAVSRANNMIDYGPRAVRVTADLVDFARDGNAPINLVFDTARAWFYHAGTRSWRDHVEENLRPVLEQHWRDTERWHLYEADLELVHAWRDRGGGYANSVSRAGWEGFAEHLAKAESHLERAWQMNNKNTTTSYQMMRVELGQGRNPARMHLWFQRTMALAPDHYEAVKLMSFYLEPRWHGSESEALEFARSCVASTDWTGRVPLVLSELHNSLAAYYELGSSPEYWHRPTVWKDIQSAYGKYFSINPDAPGRQRHRFANYAYRCGQYSTFLKVVEEFPPEIMDYVEYRDGLQLHEMQRIAGAAIVD